MSMIGNPKNNVVVDCGPSMTKQSFADQVDIKKIMDKHRKTGMVTHINSRQPFYGDVSNVTSYQEALLVVQKAEELFAGMSAKVRARFGNDPAQMIEFLENPENRQEAIELGMVTAPPEEPRPQKVEVVNATETGHKGPKDKKKGKASDDAE